MKILKSTFLCHTENCCPSINLTEKGTFFIGGTKTDTNGTIKLPLAEYQNAVSEFEKPVTFTHSEAFQNADIQGGFVTFTGRPLSEKEQASLAKPLDSSEAGIEIDAQTFWAISEQITTKAA